MDRLPAPCRSTIRLARHAADFLAYLWTLQHLKRLFHLPPDKTAEIQEKKFLSLVKYAYREIPFFRQRWDDAGVGPDDIRTIADIVKLPVITRQEVREGFRAGLFLQKGNPEKSVIFQTSGSTGEPLEVVWDRLSMLRTMTYFSPGIVSEYSGLEIRSATFVVVLGHRDTIPPFSLDNPHEAPPSMTFSRGSVSFIDALEPPSRILSFIAEKKPDFIGGYAGIITMLAAYAQEHGIPVWKPRLIGVSAEPPKPQSIRLIRDIFQAPVMTSYVTTETGLVAAEKRFGKGYEILPWDVIVELLNDDGSRVPDGEVGNVVVTTLSNRAMPLIRYAGLSDYASFKPRTEGGPHVLNAIYGRRVEQLARRDGSMVNPYLLDVIMASLQGIGQYQIVQQSIDDIEVHYVPLREENGTPVLPDTGPAAQAFARVFGPEVVIRFNPMDQIPRPAGEHKTPLIVSRVTNPETGLK
ncbi:MAG: AMP-binding enzyme [Methanoregulaceae archaeon PtaB.Bin056]|jgi:phenylacetate-CoA ligase|nr:MAG: AMP-binding enzyme [Methanoregulaceae archaeon PtaB.Bin056]